MIDHSASSNGSPGMRVKCGAVKDIRAALGGILGRCHDQFPKKRPRIDRPCASGKTGSFGDERQTGIEPSTRGFSNVQPSQKDKTRMKPRFHAGLESGGLGRNRKTSRNPRQLSFPKLIQFLGYTFGYTRLRNGDSTACGTALGACGFTMRKSTGQHQPASVGP